MPQQTVRRRAVSAALIALVLAALCLAGPGMAANAPVTARAATKTQPAAAAPAAPVAAPPATPAADATTDEPDEPDEPSSFDRHRARIQIDGLDSFQQAMDVAPWIVGVVFLVLGSIFLTPIILLVGIIWYKLRKTRLQNEAVLKLAERGVMPSAQAVDAVVSGTSPAQAAPIGAAAAAAVPQAVATRRRAVWSDLRKGVLLLAAGLATVVYAISEHGEPNWLSLVLLFVGAGYVALWWLEDRHLERRVTGSVPGDGKG